MTVKSLRIGTRGSPLALAQTHMVRALLAQAHGVEKEHFAIEIIKTTGDQIQDRPLSESGGKGLFTKELDIALIAGDIDFAVHSSKDLPTHLPAGNRHRGLSAARGRARRLDRPRGRDDRRASARRRGGHRLAAARRAGEAPASRSANDRCFAAMSRRGCGKVESGEVDATLLALAGLKRLGLADRATALLPIDDFLPAVGQGAIGITKRAGDAETRAALAPILDAATALALAAERAFLTVLDGSCRTPIAAMRGSTREDRAFHGEVLRPTAREVWSRAARAAPSTPR